MESNLAAVISEPSKGENKKTALDKVRDTFTDEVIFGICSPIGTKKDAVTEKLRSIMLNDYAYEECEIITLSEFIDQLFEGDIDKIDGSKEYVRIKSLIEKGNMLRKEKGPSYLAEVAIRHIGLERFEQAKGTEKGEDPKFKSRRVCYIIDSIKNMEELKLIRSVYRDMFYQISIFSPLQDRIHYLGKGEKKMKVDEIHNLIDQDSGEELNVIGEDGVEKNCGQEVVKAFTQGDFFFRRDDESQRILESKLKRYLHLIFDSEIITPTKDEQAMYLAASASLNSGCLSRQVGACITDSEGGTLSVGWNDVPKYTGGLYVSEKANILEKHDHRCKNLDGCYCYNDKKKMELAESVAEDLINKKVISDMHRDAIIDVILNSKVKSLIEFARSIHAEMNAIISGSQKTGDKMIGGKLYCTTYPCHNCARHIIFAGIKDVYYIEPYRKSLSVELHFDSITEDENDKNKVRILMFDGVSPRRYVDLFKLYNDRKKPNLPYKEMHPKYSLSLQALYKLESLASRNVPVGK